MKIFILTLAAVISFALPALSGGAEDPAVRGEAVARESHRRDLGFGNTKSELKMILENRKGRKSERLMRIYILEVPDENEGDKSLVIFDEPRDIKGTALLSYAHILKDDDQWLYLPALKRVKRISSSNKSGPFMGSEFAYEDITGQELKKYSYRWLRDEPCGELECFVVERRPLYKKSGYTRMVTWIDKGEYRLQRIDYYDRRDALLKTLTFSGYKQYLDRFWRATDMYMVNRQTGKKTRLLYKKYEFKTGLKDSDFTKSRLKRLR
ncbi:MAG: outer membrane lipoprotein-sorting protein [Thermodesulfobacteriota bacterium]|nr:MAG: outer membrane lipoprotein-sorting protein [Thermodesulfobacteriota bacterium]